jgi:hypothetical protein
MLDDGRMTEHSRTVDFKNTLAIMTSNIGAIHQRPSLDGEKGAPWTCCGEFPPGSGLRHRRSIAQLRVLAKIVDISQAAAEDAGGTAMSLRLTDEALSSRSPQDQTTHNQNGRSSKGRIRSPWPC